MIPLIRILGSALAVAFALGVFLTRPDATPAVPAASEAASGRETVRACPAFNDARGSGCPVLDAKRTGSGCPALGGRCTKHPASG